MSVTESAAQTRQRGLIVVPDSFMFGQRRSPTTREALNEKRRDVVCSTGSR